MEVNLLDLSCEILIDIFKYVDATDLYHLSFVCQRLNEIVKDEFLWVWCEGRTMPNTKQKIEFCEQNINRKSRVVLLAGDYRSEEIISDGFISRSVDLHLLTVLALENQYLNGSKVPLSSYPSQLEELSFRNSYVSHFREFFKACAETLKKLRVLCLDRCKWFDSYPLLALSKLPSLEILSLYLCKQLSDRDMSYISLAGLLGFKRLKILDLRFTGYGDEVLSSFHRSKSLGEIYFQGYAKTYQLDCARRRLELLCGAPTIFHNYLDPFLSVDDTNPLAMIEMFGQSFVLTSQDIQKVSDMGVKCYAYLQNELTKEYTPPKSVLYQRPYGKCKCGFMKPEPELKETTGYGMPLSFVAGTQRQQLEKLIGVLMNRKATPYVFYLELDRTAVSMDQDVPPEWAWLGIREPINDMEIFTLEHLSPMLFQLLISEKCKEESSYQNIIEVNLSRNEVTRRNERQCKLQLRRGISVARLVISKGNSTPSWYTHNLPAFSSTPLLGNSGPGVSEGPSGNEDSAPSCSTKPDEPTTSKRKREQPEVESKRRKLDDFEVQPCCSKSLSNSDNSASTEMKQEVLEDNLCFKGKVKDPSEKVAEASSDEDEDPANDVALGNEEEACSDAEAAACIPGNKKNPPPEKDDDPQPEVVPVPQELAVVVNYNENRGAGNPNIRVFRTGNMDVHVLSLNNKQGNGNNEKPMVEIVVDKEPETKNETAIRFLSLRGYDKVTDLSLRFLYHLDLDLLDVTLTSVTEQGVKLFRNMNPNCRIVHESACKCGPRLHF